jgi:hypothetical protein
LAVRSIRFRYSYIGWIVGYIYICYFFSLLCNHGVVAGLYVIRYYWGFLLFYLIFNKLNVKINVDKVLWFLSALTIIEAVLVNTVIPVSFFPNYPSSEGAFSHIAEIGNYQRPYSFGGNASVTSTILVALLSASKIDWRGRVIASIAIICCMSGTGFVALSIYILFRASRPVYLLIIFVLIGLIGSNLVYKISAEYIYYLFQFKVAQITEQLSLSSWFIGDSLMDGVAGIAGLSGDFALLTFLQFNGLIGLMLFVFVICMNIKKTNNIPLLIMVFGAFHYGVIFYFPGQIIFGYFLNLKLESHILKTKKKFVINL